MVTTEVSSDSNCVTPGKCDSVTINLARKKSTVRFECFERYKSIYDFSDAVDSVLTYMDYLRPPPNEFGRLLGKDPSIWGTKNINKSTARVLLYRGDERYILVVPTNSNMTLFHERGDYSWERINTQVNLSKLEIGEGYTHDFQEYFHSELGDSRDLNKLEDSDPFEPYYYDLDETNFKIVFNTFCHSISYSGNIIWERTRDNARHGYPNSLNFDLISGDVTITFIDGTTEPLYSIRPNVKRSRRGDNSTILVNLKLEPNNENSDINNENSDINNENSDINNENSDINNENSDVNNGNMVKEPFEPKVITLDISTIMSTNEYKTVSGPGFHHFKANDGFVFGKIVEGRRVIKKLDNPIKCYEVYEVYPAYYDNDNSNTERFQFLRPNKDNLKFYTNNKLLMPEDYKVKSTKYRYRIDFLKPLYKITYGDKVIWVFDYYEHEFLPTSLYFTHMNNMTLTFPNGVRRDVKISVNLLKMYKLQNSNTENSKMELEEGDYEIMKPGDNKRFYTLKDNIKCVEVWYDGYIVWQYDKEYPISICCDYTLDRVDIRFTKYVGSFVRFEGSSSFTQVHYFPNHLKLYAQDDKIVELDQDNYRIEVVNSTTVKYVIKPVKYDRMIFEKSLLWKQRNGAPIPRKIINKLVNPTILLHHDTSRNQTKILKFKRYKGSWTLNNFTRPEIITRYYITYLYTLNTYLDINHILSYHKHDFTIVNRVSYCDYITMLVLLNSINIIEFVSVK
ncbi:hypothetical protein TpMuguga_02g00788 [Theileria parva strain Muguga]|uniref:Uncharacterized protein n=1 Tax=Theileria parva TaxID=5875 RepID=Q4N451_THEPA|nr:uncharacterized protein TpMuguga_02g00788 [Theileria parva strain Muguga]EAN33072.1 hypothetical protein TpMuguga_02g00788 [Theileria parva strain Muguga]|eukprot:XP_765355.1 hypothetical protein [Theileria parva strain Muguga]